MNYNGIVVLFVCIIRIQATESKIRWSEKCHYKKSPCHSFKIRRTKFDIDISSGTLDKNLAALSIEILQEAVALKVPALENDHLSYCSSNDLGN